MDWEDAGMDAQGGLPLVAGVDLGGTKIQVAVLDGTEVVGQARRPTPSTNAEEVMDAIVGAVSEAVAASGRDVAELGAVGIGTPGSVDTSTGHVSMSSNVPGFSSDVALGPTVSGALGGVAVVVDNDVRVAVVGEFVRGAGRPYRNLLGVFMGTGVGGGLVLDGVVFRGRGSAGEIGHTVVKRGGRRCPCGRRGCLEAYAGRLALEQAARRRVDRGMRTSLFDIMERKGKDRLSSSVIARALERGDPLTVRLLDQAVRALGIALANAQNLLDLEAIILGGGLGDRLGAPFVERVGHAMGPHLRTPGRPPALLSTELGDLSGAVGAAVLAGGPLAKG
ncbi:MAG: ROK family protein [Acidimicrobiales bacterium]